MSRRRLSLLLVFLPLAFVGNTGVAASAPATLAALVWTDTAAELAVPLGAPTARAEFPFTVAGGAPDAAPDSAPVTIREVRVSCGCLVADWPRRPLRAGERGVLSLVFTPGERTGRHEFSVFVFTATSTAAATAAPVELRLVAQITPVLELSARYVAWERGAPAAERIVELRAPPGVTLAEPEADATLLHAQLTRAGDHWRLRLRPVSTDQPMTTRVRLNATPAGQPAQVFTVVARVP
ncbi:MAG: hypothetical protein RLZZ15_4070 [Verrucomicrobiota bacterium]|jgi:hypothetical protein